MNDIEKLLDWFEREKRDLPWRKTQDPYRIWLSEIMLQQTRVETVKEYYRRFLERFPTVCDLAAANETDVLKAWEGLGYYSRARNLHKAAILIANEYQGVFPGSYEAILALPGIGAYTAGAVGSIAFGIAKPAIDGNVKRAASRYFGIRTDISSPEAEKSLESNLTKLIQPHCPGNFNQAWIELGATLCVPLHPACEHCPLRDGCSARAKGDAELLPIHEKKRPPVSVDVGVCLLIKNGKVLLIQRNERMLGGLFVFYLAEGTNDTEKINQQLMNDGLNILWAKKLGHARHVFTHRIWEMEINMYLLAELPDGEWMKAHRAVWVNEAELRTYPLPTAMRQAKQMALNCLRTLDE